MHSGLVTAAYIAATVLFILALGGLSNQEKAKRAIWYGIVGSNEFEHAWMDEGINTYATGRTIAADYPDVFLDRYYFGGFIPWTFHDVRLSRATDYNRLWDYRRGATEDTLGSMSYRQRQDTVRYLAYDKPAAARGVARWFDRWFRASRPRPDVAP